MPFFSCTLITNSTHITNVSCWQIIKSANWTKYEHPPMDIEAHDDPNNGPTPLPEQDKEPRLTILLVGKTPTNQSGLTNTFPHSETISVKVGEQCILEIAKHD